MAESRVKPHRSIPPMPNKPEHPDKPPRHIPIPGEPTVTGNQRCYHCQKCGNVYNSREELDVHLTVNHANWLKKSGK